MLFHSVIVGSLLAFAGVLHVVPSDAGSGQDAPDECTPNEPPQIELELGQEYFGFFTLVDDTSDHYGFQVPSVQLIEIVMQPAPALSAGAKAQTLGSGLPAPDYDLRLRSGLCVLLDESSSGGTTAERIERVLEPGLYDVEVYVPSLLPTGREASAVYCDPFCILAGYGIEIRPPPEGP